MYRVEGPASKKNKGTFGQQMKAMASVIDPEGMSAFPYIQGVEMPKVKKPYKPRPNARKPHQQHEKQLQRDIVTYLRDRGCTAGLIKTSGAYFQGRYLKDKYLFVGVPDILVFTPKGQMYWIEVKWGNGGLRRKQNLFKIHCVGCGINHLVARSVSDVKCLTD